MISGAEGAQLHCAPTVYQVTRQLKKERNSLYNCLCSIIDDSLFIEELRSLYPGVPVLANLRCGLWYTPEPDDTCYFKSTDGHMGNWSFSTIRLNLHVAERCAAQGGIILVDATRNAHKGGYPDALTKTVPIWATVINRAIARVRAMQHRTAQHVSSTMPIRAPVQNSSKSVDLPDSPTATQDEDSSDSDTFQFDIPRVSVSPPRDPIAPLFNMYPPVPSYELPVPSLTCTQQDSEPCDEDCQYTDPTEPVWDTALHLPLWITSNEVKQVEARLDSWADLLLATSQGPIQQLAQTLRKPLRPLWISQSSRIWIDQVAQPCELDFTPLYLVTASRPVHGERRQCPHTRRQQLQAQHMETGHGAVHQHQDECSTQGWTYLYVPGAGDDEESWAAGLTPQLMWQHHEALMEAGPAGVHLLVQRLIKGRSVRSESRQVASGMGGGAAGAGGSVVTDAHHLAPEGCRAAGSGQVQHLGQGAYLIADSQLVLGGREAGQPPCVWQHAEAVLYCGMSPHPGMQPSSRPPAGTWHRPAGGRSGTQPCVGSAVELESDDSMVLTDKLTHGNRQLTEQQLMHMYGMSQAQCMAAVDSDALLTPRFQSSGDLYSVDSLSASGISPCASSLQLALPAACCHTPVPAQQQEEEEEEQQEDTGMEAPDVTVPATISTDTFEFHLETVVDMTPPDYISVNLQLDSHQRSELRAQAGWHDSVQDAGRAASQAAGLPRYCWLPVSSSKQGRGSLQAALQDALDFVQHHLEAGRRVMIHDDEGVDQCVCVAVAVMLSCNLSKVDAQKTDAGLSVSKALVRHTLARLASSYPHARPTRGMLKQVFAFFHGAQD